MSCRIVEVIRPLRQFAYHLGSDYMPGDILFAPAEKNPEDGDAERIFVTTKPHGGGNAYVPVSCIKLTDYVAELQPAMPVLTPARAKVNFGR